MDRFTLDLDFPEALGLYIFFRGREEELEGASAALAVRLRDFLYDRLSIEDMEQPEKYLARLARDR
jgi:hypothetical protein